MQHDESVGRKRANESKPRGSLTSASTVSRVAAHQHAAFSYPSHPILAVSSALALSLVFVTHVHVAPDLGLDAVVPICCKIGWSLAHITCTSTSTRGRYRCPRKLFRFRFFLSFFRTRIIDSLFPLQSLPIPLRAIILTCPFFGRGCEAAKTARFLTGACSQSVCLYDCVCEFRHSFRLMCGLRHRQDRYELRTSSGKIEADQDETTVAHLQTKRSGPR